MMFLRLDMLCAGDMSHQSFITVEWYMEKQKQKLVQL